MSRRKPAIRGIFAGLLGLIALSVAPSVASAANPTILNTGTGCTGQTSWLVTCATPGQTDNSANQLRISVLVSHDTNTSLASLITDDDWDGTVDPDTVRTVTEQRPSIASGYPRSRANLTYTLPTTNTGMSCAGPISGTRRTTDRNARIQARDSAGQTSGTSSSQIKFVATGGCTGIEDFAYVYGLAAGNFNRQATPGQTGLVYTYNGDDADTSGNSDFQGIFWRYRNLRTGAVTGGTLSCPGGGDNSTKTLTATAPSTRGAYVLEAELRDGSGCTQDQNAGFWFAIGTVDVNSSSIPAPTITASRPNVNGNTTITVDPPTDPDSAAGGGPQIIQWDLDQNTGNGVSGFEVDSVAAEGAIFSTNQTKTINTTGMAPGLYTVRARVIDNGAMDAADSIREVSSTVSTTFRVDALPVANNSTATTETETPVSIPLNATDSDGDTLTYTIQTPPTHGVLTGTGASRTYTPAATFAGTDFFTWQVSDGFGGTDTATVNITVTPDTTIDAGTSGTNNSRAAHFEFSSHALGATFECSLDGASFSNCSSPIDYTDLADGSHTFQVRANAAFLTDPTPATRSFTVNASPTVTITSGNSGLQNNNSASFSFTASENGNTVALDVECRLDGGTYTDCTSPQNYTGLSEGPHTFDVRATDQYGKTGSDTRTFTVDTVAPDTVIDTGPSGPTNDASPSFTFHSTESGSTFECSVDGAAFSSCSSPANTGPFAAGSHTFAVRATDQATNTDQTPAQNTFVVDLTAPDTTITSGPSNGDFVGTQTPTFEFEGTDDSTGVASFECAVDGGTFTPCSSPASPSLGEGLHTFSVRAVDAAGNRDQTPDSRTFTVDVGPPDTSIVSGPADGGRTGDNTPTFGFSATESPVTYECSVDGSSFTTCSNPFTTSTLSDGSHTIDVQATDSAGNTDPSPASRTFTVDTQGPDTTIDSTPPALTNQTSATFTFSSASPDAASFECRIDSSNPGDWSACTSPKTYSGLSQGSHTFQVRALDDVGNPDPSPASYTFSVDSTAPDTNITTGPSGPTGDNTPTFEFTSTESPATFECAVDGSAFTSCTSPYTTSPLSDGPHTFEVRSTDQAGNTDATPASRSFSVDTAGAETTILTGPPNPTNQTSANFTYTSNEAPLVTYECSLDNAAFTACLPTGQSYTGLSAGSHNFRVRSVDLLGNPDPTPASYTWTIDLTPPNTTIDSGPNPRTTNKTPGFTFSSTEANSSFECRYDAAAFQPCSSPYTTSPALSDGSHTFEVRATDQAGNTDASPASRTFTVDTTPPETTIDFGPTGTTTDNQPTFTFSSSEPNSTFECSVDNAGFTPCTSPFTTAKLDDGPHNIRVRATDDLGNTDQTPAQRTFTVDATGPDTFIDSGPPSPTNSTSATFTFSASESPVTFQCKLDAGAFTSCSSGQTYTGLSEGSHTFQVRAFDAGGNVDPSPASRTWVVDTTPPNTTINSGPSGPTNDATPTFTFSSEAGATFQCSVDSAAFTACTSPHTTAALGQGAHTFQVRAIDQAGNVDATPDSRSFSVDTVPPNTVIDTGPTGPTADNTPDFTFHSTETGSTFECRVDGDDFAACTSPFTTSTLSDGQHSFQVRAIDAVGNVDQSPAVRNFSVDTTAPDTVIDSGPSGLHNQNSATFTFHPTEVDNVTLECSLDNAAFTSCTSPKTYTGLSEGAHNFRVRAVDALNNADQTPASRNFTVDTIAPQTTINGGPSGPTPDNTPTWTFSSEPNATFECRIDSGSFGSCTSPFTASTLSDGQHTFEVRATDQAGNTDQTPDSRTFTVDTIAPDTNIDDGPSGPTADNTPTWQFSSPDGTATFQCRIDTGAFADCSSPFTAPTLSDGSHTFEVRAVDPATNQDATPASRTIVVDTTAPQTTINTGPAAPTADNTPSFTYSSSEANSTFECRIDSDAFAACDPGGFTAPPLADGAHTFQVRATDPLGNQDQSAASRSFSVDTTPPDTTINSNPPALSNSSSASFTFSNSADPNVPATFECSLDLATFTSCSSPQGYSGLSDGQHNFRVRASDSLGNQDQSAASYTWSIDTVAPQTTINFGPQNSTSNPNPTFGFSSSQGGSSFECRVDAAAFTPCTSPHQTGPLSAGSHTFDVRATDPYGNTDASPATRTFTVDPNGPSTQIDSGPTGTTNDNTPTFTFSSSKPNSTFECFVDGGAGFDCTSPHTITPALDDGEHTFEVQATDSAGNTDPVPAGVTFTVDATAPETTLDSAPSGLTNSNDATFEFSSNDNDATFECSLDNAAYGPCTSPVSEDDLSDGEHTFSVRASDPHGNTDQTPASSTFTVDTQAPSTSIDSGPSGTTNDDTPTFTFSSENGATFECRIDTGAFADCTSPFTASQLSDGQHTFEVQGTDEAGNTEGTAQSRTFIVDTTAPDTTIASATVTDNDVTVNFSSPDSGATFECKLDGGAFEPCTSPKTYNDLSVGQHTIQVQATDTAGNTDQTPASTQATVNEPPDTTAPQTTIDSGTVTDDSATFTFSSSESGSTFTCSLDGGAAQACTSPKTYTGLSEGDHTLSVTATDGSGNADPTPATRTVTVEDQDPVPLPGRCANVKNGTSSGETLRGTAFGDLIRGGGGADRIFGLNGQDCLNGGLGNDTVNGGSGADTIKSGRGNDTVIGGPGADQIFTDGASDIIRARDGVRDVINCGKSKDTVFADARDRVASNCETVKP